MQIKFYNHNEGFSLALKVFQRSRAYEDPLYLPTCFLIENTQTQENNRAYFIGFLHMFCSKRE